VTTGDAATDPSTSVETAASAETAGSAETAASGETPTFVETAASAEAAASGGTSTAADGAQDAEPTSDAGASSAGGTTSAGRPPTDGAPPVEGAPGVRTTSARAGRSGERKVRRFDIEADDRQRERPAPTPVGQPEPTWEPEQWIDEGELREEAAEAVGRGGTTAPVAKGRGRRKWTPNEDLLDDDDDEPGSPAGAGSSGDTTPEEQTAAELRKAFGAQRAGRAEARLREASNDFRRERYEDARKLLRPLAEQAPSAASVRELFGLTLYRLGRWAPARRELEAFRVLTGSVEQHPVLADCYRALGRYHEVEELWDELKAASPSGELVAEGRIVAAGALADQGRLDDAIELLLGGIKPTRRPRPHHLRMIYALADLYERAGDAPRARELFGRVAAADAEFVDVQSRLRALR
jgi:hypothetical protein